MIDDPALTPAENVAAAVAERARVFAATHFPPPLPPVPDVPASRYDTCATCGESRWIHGRLDLMPRSIPRHSFVLGEKFDLSWLNPHLHSAPEEGSR